MRFLGPLTEFHQPLLNNMNGLHRFATTEHTSPSGQRQTISLSMLTDQLKSVTRSGQRGQFVSRTQEVIYQRREHMSSVVTWHHSQRSLDQSFTQT